MSNIGGSDAAFCRIGRFAEDDFHLDNRNFGGAMIRFVVDEVSSGIFERFQAGWNHPATPKTR